MEITIIKAEDPLETTRHFGILLSKALSSLHMMHWYVKDLNIHEIWGSLYEDLDGLFDKFQEEIIGTSQSESMASVFPGFSADSIPVEVSLYPCDNETLLENYYKWSVTLLAVFSSREIDTYIQSVVSGLNNTKEDIISRINKANYLLSMCVK